MDMRYLALLLLACPAFAADTVEAFGYKWKVPAAADWAVEGSGAAQVLRMTVQHPDTRQLPRRPAYYALAQTAPMTEVTLDVEVRRLQERGALILIYAWKDENHFNYAHFSPDAPSKQPVHSGIFHVYGGDRVRISGTEGPGTLPDMEWTPVHLTYSAKTHRCEVTVGGRPFTSLQAVDLSLDGGLIGVGSFFNSAEFRKLQVHGK
jgi:hypothetical protein